MEYKIVDNFLSKEEFSSIKEVILGNNFPWFLKPYVSYEWDTEDCYFQHTFYQDNTINSNHMFVLDPIIKKLDIKALIRVRGNLYTRKDKIIEHGKHVDFDFSHKLCIFYLNNNDGFTRLEDGTVVESIENRALFTDGSILHNSTNCTNNNFRINLSFNYF